MAETVTIDCPCVAKPKHAKVERGGKVASHSGCHHAGPRLGYFLVAVGYANASEENENDFRLFTRRRRRCWLAVFTCSTHCYGLSDF